VQPTESTRRSVRAAARAAMNVLTQIKNQQKVAAKEVRKDGSPRPAAPRLLAHGRTVRQCGRTGGPLRDGCGCGSGGGARPLALLPSRYPGYEGNFLKSSKHIRTRPLSLAGRRARPRILVKSIPPVLPRGELRGTGSSCATRQRPLVLASHLETRRGFPLSPTRRRTTRVAASM